MKQIVRIALILSTTILLFGCSKTPEEKIASLREQFAAKLARFDYKGAEAVVGEISAIDPNSPVIISSNGMMVEQRMWAVDAFDAYGSLMKLAPNSPEGYLGAYRIQKRLGALDIAVTTADKLGQVDAKNPQSISLLAEAVLQVRMPQLAIRIIDSAQKLGLSEGEVNFLRARALFASGKADSARTCAAVALKSKTSTPRYYEVAADYYEAIGYADSSMLFSQMEMESAKKLPLVWIHHFDRSLRLGYFAANRQIQRDIIAAGADSAVIFTMQTEYYNASNRFVEASNAAIYQAAHAGPTSMSRSLQELKSRVGILDQIQVADMLSVISSPLQSTPMSEAAHEFLSSYFYINYAIESDARQGLKLIERVYGSALNTREFRSRWLSLMYYSGDFKRFDSLKAIYDQQYASQYDWQMYMGDMYTKAGPSHYEEARDRYEAALQLAPSATPAFEHYLDMLEKFARYTEAVQLFERFPQFAAESPALAIKQAANLVMVGRRPEAMQLFETAVKVRSGDMRAINQFLDALDQRYDAEGKNQALTMLAAAAPDNTDIMTITAIHALDTKDYAKGKELAEAGIKRDPDQAVFHVLIGRAQLGLGESDKVLQVLDSLFTYHQHDPDYVYQYSRLLSENGINLDRAANLARGSVMYSNYQIRDYLNLIDIYYQMGRYDLSWNESSNIAVSFPTRPEGFYRLGRAGVKLGKPDNKLQLEKSIALGLGGDELADAKKILSQLN